MRAKICLAAGLAASVVLSVLAQGPPASEPFFDAIRNNNLPALRALIAEHGTEVRGEGGMPVLVMAAAYGTDEAVALLVDAGANVNAARADGITALHVSWRSDAIVQRLLERGAVVNAKTASGSTPLFVASSANGTAAVVARLLAKGADVNGGDTRGVTPLIAAAGVGNSAVAKLLLAHGADPNAYASGGGQKTATPLMGAAHNADLDLARRLLARKVDVNVQSPESDGTVKNGPVAFGSLSALHLAAAAASTPMVTLLLDAGATIDAGDVRGYTPLDWAIASDRPNQQVVSLLVKRGAARSAPSAERAGGWARRYNQPAILSELKLAAINSHAPTSAPAPASTAREAVERSVPLLRAASARVMTDGGCVACHAQPISAAAATLALRRGWSVPEPDVERSQVTSAVTSSSAGSLQNRETGGLPDTQLYNIFMMAEMKLPATLGTEAFVSYLAAKQRDGGQWHGIATRAPIQDGDFSRTAMAIRALSVYGSPARRTEWQARISRAAAWLAAQRPRSTEERVMQLLGLQWAGGDTAARDKGQRELAAAQRPDGGWSQTPYLASDAYATGQALYALNTLGVPASNAELRRGVAFLLRTQEPDGAWHVTSRAMKIQPYFDSGFPHGDDQWVSQSGTAWAVMGLALAGEGGGGARTTAR